MAQAKKTSNHPVEKYFESVSRYHYFLFTFLFLSKIPIFWHVVSLLFLAPPMNYQCDGKPGNESRNTCPCDNPVWDKSVFTQTLQTKYGIYCDTKWQIAVSHSMLYVGSLLGSFSFGFMSDKYGRLTSFCVCLFMMAFFGTLTVFMPNMAMFILIRLLQGIGVGGSIVTGYVYCVEYCGVGNREVISALFHVPLNVGHMTLAGLSYLLRDCDQYILAICIPTYFFATMKLFLQESPKWLMDSNQMEKAYKSMEIITKFNKTPFAPLKAEMDAHHAKSTQDHTPKARFWDIFRYRNLVINFSCMSFIYFVCGMGYYGVSQYIGQMSGKIHVNVALSGAMLIPGSLIATYLLYVLSRRTFLMSTNLLSGILMIIVVLMPASMALLRVLIACICNACFFMSFITVFLYGVELFPTVVRNSVLGVLTVMARVGQIIAPQINVLPPKVSGTTFGVLAVVGGLLCIPLPETKNRDLPTTLEDSQRIANQKQDSSPTAAPPVAGPGVKIT